MRILLLLPAVLLSLPAVAQIELGGRNLYTLEGDQFLGRFGWAVTAADVNGDGLDDLIAGAPSETSSLGERGRVQVYSGADGTLLYEVSSGVGLSGFAEFGEAVAALDDLNGDGAEEFLVGAPEGQVGNENPGFARVIDGATGTVLSTLNGDVFFDAFGQAVTGLGDLDGDGLGDFAVGAPRPQTQAPFQPGPGFVRVFSSGGTALVTLSGTNDFERYGDALASAGDINLDGHDDLLIGVPGHDSNGFNGNGRIEVVSGEWIATTAAGATPLTPKLLALVEGDLDIAALGFAVAGVGDTNGDGYPDFLAGAPNADLNGSYRGIADLYSGEWFASTAIGAAPQTSQRLDRFAGDGERDLFGRSVAALGDLDGDGFADFVIGASEAFSPGPGPGYAVVYSGATGDDITSYRGTAGGDRVGWVLFGGRPAAGILDFNGDGSPDLAMGADLGSGDINGNGTAHALSGAELLLSADEHLISLSVGTRQQFVVRAGAANAGRQYWLLGSRSGTTPGTPVLNSGLVLPLNLDSYLLLTVQLGNGLLEDPLGMLDQGGEAEPALDVPAGLLAPALVGLTLHHAYVAFDQVGATLDFELVSNAVPTTLVP